VLLVLLVIMKMIDANANRTLKQSSIYKEIIMFPINEQILTHISTRMPKVNVFSLKCASIVRSKLSTYSHHAFYI